MDMNILMDIHVKSVDMDRDMDMDGKFNIQGKFGKSAKNAAMRCVLKAPPRHPV